jgi:co-chaperonin GroES (HSP10)
MAIPKLEECRLGMRATGWNLIVVPEEVEQQLPSGLWKPDSVTDKEKIVQQRGRVVSVGPAAFTAADYAGEEPTEGDAVIFSKLAGFTIQLADGKMARVIQDRDVAVILDEEAA